MKLKGSSSTFLCALVGLSVLLCVVNEAQGWACYRHLNGEAFKEVRIEDCSTDKFTIPCKGDTPYQGCLKSKTGYALKDCGCSSKNEDFCENGDCFCKADFCNDDKLGENGGKGGAASPVLAFSTLFSSSAMVIITSSFWTLF